ncbi:MAG: AmmeMemoRadiSam system protein B [Proteobacteria bacterium]|nr:AmmeMemoRadiSam system protein B [Pseudomonadota bacterium]
MFVTLMAGSGPAQAASGPEVRPAVLAGTWYPADPGRLRRSIQGFLSKARARASLPARARLIALIVPRAGHRFSGPVAAVGYKLLPQRGFECVLIIAPSHRVAFRGVSIFKGQAYATPLGRVPLDRALSAALRKQPGFGYAWPIHRAEHAIEIQLPFLQVALGKFKLIAAVMGRPSLARARITANGVLEAIGRTRVLLVASTDLSHFYSEKKAHALDRVLIKHVRALDVLGLARSLTAGKCFACGAGPLMAVMIAAKKLGANRAIILKYATSADTGGGRRSVVGYLAAALYRDPRAKAAPLRPSSSGGVYSAAERRHLKKIARRAVVARLTGRPAPRIRPRFKALGRRRGAFVTIKRQGRLRGCIGHVRATKPLYLAVAEAALAAAFNDPRFKPITRRELADLEFEISVLSPFRPVKSFGEIVVGRHGLLIVSGRRAGLLLPQVPVEFGWTREQFLAAVCRKAGLAADAWRGPGPRLYKFTAEVF